LIHHPAERLRQAGIANDALGPGPKTQHRPALRVRAKVLHRSKRMIDDVIDAEGIRFAWKHHSGIDRDPGKLGAEECLVARPIFRQSGEKHDWLPLLSRHPHNSPSAASRSWLSPVPEAPALKNPRLGSKAGAFPT